MHIKALSRLHTGDIGATALIIEIQDFTVLPDQHLTDDRHRMRLRDGGKFVLRVETIGQQMKLLTRQLASY